MIELPWDAIAPSLINFTLACAGYLLFKRSVSAKAAVVIALAVAALGFIDPLYYVMSTWFPTGNPQVSTLLLVAILLPLSAGQLLFKKRRTLDRILMTIALLAVAGTTLVFHYLFVGQALSTLRDAVFEESRVMLMLNDDRFMQVCEQRGFTCSTTKDLSALGLPDAIQESLLKIQADTEEAARSRVILHSYAILNDIQNKGIGFVTFLATPDVHRVVVATSQAEEAHHLVKQTLYFLVTVADLVWLTLALGLIHTHRRAFRGRTRPRATWSAAS